MQMSLNIQLEGVESEQYLVSKANTIVTISGKHFDLKYERWTVK